MIKFVVPDDCFTQEEPEPHPKSARASMKRIATAVSCCHLMRAPTNERIMTQIVTSPLLTENASDRLISLAQCFNLGMSDLR
jgi:hypothetical protein